MHRKKPFLAQRRKPRSVIIDSLGIVKFSGILRRFVGKKSAQLLLPIDLSLSVASCRDWRK